MNALSTFALGLSVFAFLLSAEFTAGQPVPPKQDPPAVPLETIRPMLGEDAFKRQRFALVKMGRAAFPAFEAILADPKSDPAHVARIFIVLSEVKADRGQFLDTAVRRLADADGGVRGHALHLVEQIGSTKDIPPIVALLSDKDRTIAHAAATVLLAMGDQRTAVAMDVWLNSESHQDVEWLRKHVTKCRDELKQRLEKQKKQPGK